MPLKWLALVAGLTFAGLSMPPAAEAACSATIDTISFGTVDTLSTPTVNVTANVAVHCTGATPLLGVTVCANIGTGNGGTGNAPRVMAGTPGGTLGYQLYTNSGRTTVWGTGYGTAFGTVPTISVPTNASGTGDGSAIIYAQLPASASPVAPGSYLSTFTTAYTSFDYSLTTALNCNLLNSLQSHATPTFTVSAQVDKNCLVNADNISFGSQGLLTSAVTATGRVGVKCTPSTSYDVALGNGLTGTGPTARKMTLSSESITYGLYHDGYSLPWGSTSGTNTVTGTGTGSQQDITVYGKVPVQSTPSPGTYSDTVVVTVTY